jgi:plasmid stability protein
LTTLSIKDVPEHWAEALRQRAARNHRSLQGELTAILEAAVQPGVDAQASPRGIGPATNTDQVSPGHAAMRKGRKTIEQIAQEHRQRFPEPIRGGPLAVDIIRGDRDSR